VKWLPSAKGKLVMVNGLQPTCRPREDWAHYATPSSAARMDTVRAALQREWSGRNVRGTGYNLALGTGDLGLRMEKAGIAGMITSQPTGAWGAVRVFETYNTLAPAISLSCEDYGLVYRLTESGRGPRIRLNLDAELLGETPIFNTVASIRGTEKPNEYVVLSAHFDSWDGASGATDNGTGTLTMMEAMRLLKLAYPNPKRTILVGHWTAEEEGLVGSRAFAQDHPEVVQGLQALFNQDNGTGRILRIQGSGLPNAAEHMAQWLAKMPMQVMEGVEFGGVGYPGTGGTDESSFSCFGVPTFGLGSLDWNYFSYTWHTNIDTFDKVVFDDLRANATLTAMLAYAASEDPAFITRERIDLAAAAAAADQTARTGRRSYGPPREWPTCSPADRKTAPRLR
jgi:carboxypeptidase Q